MHSQYKDHYPAGMIPADSPEIVQYRTALTYSKGRFFDHLLAGLDRSNVAIVYQSDHGQNLTPGKLPHCSLERVPSEYQIRCWPSCPMASAPASPPRRKPATRQARCSRPCSNGWATMRQRCSRRYDTDLTGEPVRYVRFGRDVVPLNLGGTADVTVSGKFPA